MQSIGVSTQTGMKNIDWVIKKCKEIEAGENTIQKLKNLTIHLL